MCRASCLPLVMTSIVPQRAAPRFPASVLRAMRNRLASLSGFERVRAKVIEPAQKTGKQALLCLGHGTEFQRRRAFARAGLLESRRARLARELGTRAWTGSCGPSFHPPTAK